MSVALLLPLLGPIAAALAGAPALTRSPAAVDQPASASHGSLVQQDRVYALSRLNGKAVPAEVEFATTAGSRHWVRMEEAILRLKRDGTFVASARFYRELLQAGNTGPTRNRLRLLNDGATGRYTIRGDTLVLNVAKRKDTAASTIHGRMAGERVRIRHTLRDGTFRHSVDVELRLDPTIW
jgi:hypothetical protein